MGGWAYSYDANGNLTSGQGKTFTWNAATQPMSITANGVTEAYDDDADGQRLMRSVGGVTTVSVGDGYEEDLPTGTTRTVYPLNGQVIAQRTTTGATSTVIYLHSDQLGSVSAATNASGALVSKQDFGPWGTVRSGGISETTVNFTGQRRDSTGLLFYNARYYDPNLARFVSADTIGFDLKQPQTTNRYSYVLNNPLKYTDPTGNCSAPNRNNPDIQEENARCRALQIQLADLGLLIQDFDKWLSWQLNVLLTAVNDLMARAGWTPTNFKDAIGIVKLYRVSGQGYFQQYNGRDGINLDDSTFANNGPDDKDDNTKYTFITELTHVWDARSGGRLSSGIVSATQGQWDATTGKYVMGDQANVGYTAQNPAEDFAAAVATSVYGPRNGQDKTKDFTKGQRYTYVQNRFAGVTACRIIGVGC